MEKNQLKMSEDRLIDLGFSKKEYETETGVKSVYEIPSINGCFYYNPNEPQFVWYHKVIIGETANHTLLDITHEAHLLMVLQIFKVEIGKFVIIPN